MWYRVYSMLVLFAVVAGSCESRVTEQVADAGVDPITVGILHSRTGPLAISETAVIEATLLAIEDVNDQGGVLGRPLQPLIVDGSSDEVVFAREARGLLQRDQVPVVFGCWTSASRKAVKPIFEEYDGLLFYPVQYEGLEQSPNIIYAGACPNQQILPAVDWAMDGPVGARRFLLVGSDYVFPHAANAIIRDYVDTKGGEIVGEAYVPLGGRDVSGLIELILETDPDMILNSINGDTNIDFFRELREAEIGSDEIPTISFSIGESELRGMSSAHVCGDYAAWNYFQSIPGKTNLTFVRQFGDRFHPRRVLSDPMQSAWNAVHLWAAAVNQAGSLETDAVREALPSIRFQAPEGEVKVDPENQHLWMHARIGQITPARFFDIVWESDKPQRPQPYPDSRSPEEWQSFLDDLYRGWGNRWSAVQTQ